MKKALLLAVGVAIGVVVARRLDSAQTGGRGGSGLGRALREFVDAVVEGYQQRESELRSDAAAADTRQH